MATVEATKENFESLIDGNETVIFDFWAPWCGPCRSFGPTFEKASESHEDIVFAKVNTEEQQELAGALGIQSIPTLMVFKEQIGVFSQPGALPASALDSVINQVKKLNMDEVRAELKKQDKQTA